MEVSSGFVWADVDAAGQGTGLSATVAGDVIASSVLTINIREAVTRVEDSSSTWDAGGDPQIAAYVRSASGNIDNVSGVVVSPTDGSAFWISGYNYSLSAWETVKDNSGTTWIAGGGGVIPDDVSGNWEGTYINFQDTSANLIEASDGIRTFSGNMQLSTVGLSSLVDASTAVLDASVGALNVFSGSVETSTTVLDASVDALNVFSGSVETSTTVLDASVGALNVFSGSVETSTTVLDASVDALNVFSGSVETSTTVLDASVDALNVFSGSVETSTAGIRDSSGTAWLTGATPTLSNDLNANGNSIRGANLNVCSTTGDLVFSAVGTQKIDFTGHDVKEVKYIYGRNDTGNDGFLIVSGNTNYIIGKEKINIGNTTGDVSSLIDMIYDLASVSGTGGGTEIQTPHAVNGVAYYSGVGGFGVVAPSPTTDGDALTFDGSKLYWGQPKVENLLGAAGALLGTTLVYNNSTSKYESGAHGDISGLDQDDHTQYLLNTGARAASGNISIENYDDTPPSDPIALILKTIDSSPTSPTNIGEVRFAGNNSTPANKVYNRLRGVADDVTAGTEDGSIELRHLTAGSEVVSLTANGTGVTVEESLTVSTCPVPAPVCYAQMDGDGTAAASETKFGAGVTPTTVEDSTGHITWDNTNKEFDISVAGTYHVLATLNMYVDATTLPTIRIKNGATTKNSYVAHGVHSAERPEEITIQAAFTCAASDTITVTFQDDAATDINLKAGSSVIARRLF